MKFSKVYGKVDSKIVRDAEAKLSGVFAELALSFDNKTMGTNIGGDPLVFQLVSPVDHVCDATAIELDAINDKIKKLVEDNNIPEEQRPTEEELVKWKEKMRGRVLRTAATDGKKFYWNPQFVLDTSRAGLRLVVAHEAWHAIYMHPSRRGARLPRLWNIAVDYKVDNTVMLDLIARNDPGGSGNKESVKKAENFFTESLGEYISLDEYASFLKDPYNPPPRLAHMNPIHDLKNDLDPAYGHPGKDHCPMYFSDSHLPDDLKRPENIYEYLLGQVPKCPECGKLGMYKKPDEVKKLQKQLQAKQKEEKEKKEKEKKKQEEDKKFGVAPGQQAAGNKPDDKNSGKGIHQHTQGGTGENEGEEHSHTSSGEGQGEEEGQAAGEDGESCGHGAGQHSHGQQGAPGQKGNEHECDDHSCGTCGDDDGDYFDPFGGGDLIDDHFDTDISEDQLNRRLQDAIQGASRMGGVLPAGLEGELGELLSPTIRWQDLILNLFMKIKRGHGRNDWSTCKTKPLFAGLYIPKKKDYHINTNVFFDCSGSMSAEDISFGIQQLQVMGEKATINLIPFDTIPYFEKMVQIRKADIENLSKAKRTGLGGTAINKCFQEYEKHTGKVDLIIAITDGFLSDHELRDVKVDKSTQVVWLITSHNPNFRPPFGRILHLRNERLSGK